VGSVRVGIIGRLRQLCRQHFGEPNFRCGSILLKNPVSSQGRKTSRDMARLDLEVPRAYLSTTFASPEFALVGCTESCWQLTLSMTS
jgi:hypothetical protein